MDTKANLANRKKINELAIQHNKLTTLVACLLNEVGALKKELQYAKGGDMSNSSTGQRNSNQPPPAQQQNNPNRFPNFNDLRAEDILKQLSINTSSSN